MALEAGKAATGHDRTAGPVARPAQGPKRWKHFLITVMGVYPLIVLIPISLTWLAHYLPGGVRANYYNVIATSGRPDHWTKIRRFEICICPGIFTLDRPCGNPVGTATPRGAIIRIS